MVDIWGTGMGYEPPLAYKIHAKCLEEYEEHQPSIPFPPASKSRLPHQLSRPLVQF